ncbi:hypothetical protein J6590_029596 [Homalodisca vitripennis]|nr:hypothetical protein J6590_029596 [Homalodisca vitripennis]
MEMAGLSFVNAYCGPARCGVAATIYRKLGPDSIRNDLSLSCRVIAGPALCADNTLHALHPKRTRLPQSPGYTPRVSPCCMYADCECRGAEASQKLDKHTTRKPQWYDDRDGELYKRQAMYSGISGNNSISLQRWDYKPPKQLTCMLIQNRPSRLETDEILNGQLASLKRLKRCFPETLIL